jgi:REP element-mobilizing transposase RayT
MYINIVWTPKYRYKILEGEIKEFTEESIRGLCEWKRIEYWNSIFRKTM